MIYHYKFETILGDFLIASKDSKVINLSLSCDDEKVFFDYINKFKEETVYSKEENEFAVNEIKEYLKGNLKKFTIKTIMNGTAFQKKVWNELMNIPYGEVRSYKQIAEKVNSPKAYRAVGLANNKNNIPIIIPCHRVIGSNNSLVGYAGGIDMKKKLLDIEGWNKFEQNSNGYRGSKIR